MDAWSQSASLWSQALRPHVLVGVDDPSDGQRVGLHDAGVHRRSRGRGRTVLGKALPEPAEQLESDRMDIPPCPTVSAADREVGSTEHIIEDTGEARTFR